MRAIKERVFFVKQNGNFVKPHRPVYSDVHQILLPTSMTFDKIHTSATSLSPCQFADTYRGRRRTVLIKAAEDNLRLGFHDGLATVKAFMKCEKYNFTTKPDAVPRIIQPRDPRFIVECGRYVKPIEHQIYKHLDNIYNDFQQSKLGNKGRTPLDHKTVFKGLNAIERGAELSKAWNSYSNPVAIGIDAHRFDQHVSKAMLQWEHEIYQKYYPNDDYFRHLMSLQLVNKGKCYLPDGRIKYQVEGCRMSGDSNTSLGNVLIMCSMLYCYRLQHNLDFDLINDGDDCVLICDSRSSTSVTQNLDQFFSTLGFKLTVEPIVTVFEQIEFCQSHPVWDGHHYVMVRDPRTSISKDALSLKPLDNINVYQSWSAAVGAGGLALTSGIPVLQSFYQYFERCADGATPLIDPTLEGGFFRLSEGMTARIRPPTDDARLSFYLAFGISPQVQYCLEDHYQNLKPNYSITTLSQYRWMTLPL